MQNQIENTLALTVSPRLDRSKFKAQTFEAADHQFEFWLTKTPAERLLAAKYLIGCAWGFDIQKFPRMDKSVFSARKHYC